MSRLAARPKQHGSNDDHERHYADRQALAVALIASSPKRSSEDQNGDHNARRVAIHHAHPTPDPTEDQEVER